MEVDLTQIAKLWLSTSIAVKQSLLEDHHLFEQIIFVSKTCAESCNAGHKILFAGNGGSAADAQHLAGEFVSRFNYDRPGLSAFALTVDTSVITAIGNDYGYERLFERQIQANAKKGDIFIGLSTSGNSSNIINALHQAKSMGIFTVGFTGKSGGQMNDLCDVCVKVPSNETPRIQECHITLGHIVCGLVEQLIFPKK
ncbi:D-sedoheptulose 7-phosphate isomerase [Ampullimonas aquatilis]|uniref:D-sedoheptulose 7-phosphate isomerase n=1 Tax=Ampullimonas aquatilis TaxID=1341549 RepID=UPI003C771BA3